jgi:hypothetical protein
VPRPDNDNQPNTLRALTLLVLKLAGGAIGLLVVAQFAMDALD